MTIAPATARHISPFVGRQREWASLTAAWEGARQRRGRFIAVGGPAGSGKTRLLDEWTNEVRGRGARIVRGRGDGTDTPAFWPWTQIVRSCIRDLSLDRLTAVLGGSANDFLHVIPELAARLSQTAPAGAIQSPQARFRLFDAITRLLEEVAGEQPLVVAIDDLHDADPSSLELLRFVIRAIHDLPVLVLGAYRDQNPAASHDQPLREILTESLRSPGWEHLRLGGLSESEAAQLLCTFTGDTPPATMVRTLHQRTEGNPLFLVEFAHMLARTAPESAYDLRQLVIPDTIRVVIRLRLDRLSAACRDTLSMAAVLGGDVRPAILARLLDVAQVSAGIEEALKDGLLEPARGESARLRFSNALIRETLYADVEPSRRRALHEQLGDALELLAADDPPLAELAHHFAAAASPRVACKGVRYARAAAERAFRSWAYEEAARLYTLALDAEVHAPEFDEADRCAILLALGNVQNIVADPVRARETFLTTADSARRIIARDQPQGSLLLAQAAMGFAGGWTGVNEVLRFDPARPRLFDPEVLNLGEEALAALGDAAPAVRAPLLARLAVELVYAAPLARREALIEEARTLARRLDDPVTLAIVLYFGRIATWGPHNGSERLAMMSECIVAADRAGDVALRAAAHGMRSIDQLELARLDDMERDAVAFVRLADEARQPFLQWAVMVHRGMRALLGGRFDEAEPLICKTFELGQRGRASAMVHFGAQMQALRLLQGRTQELAMMAAGLKTLVDQFPEMVSVRTQIAYLSCEVGDLETARRELDYLAARDFTDVREDLIWLLTLAEAVEVCAAVGDRRRAALLYDLMLPHAAHHIVGAGAATCWGSAARSLGLLASVLERYDDAAAHFEAALAANRRLRTPPWIAKTEIAYATMLLARGNQGDAEHAHYLANQAQTVARSLGMQTLVDQAERTLEHLRPRPPEAPVTDARIGNDPVVLCHRGDYWIIGYRGEEIQLRDSKGLRYLAILVRHPDREFHALALAGMTETRKEVESGGSMQRQADDGGDRGAPLDGPAKRAYRERIGFLRNEIDEAERGNDLGRLAVLRAELDALTDQLSAAVGLGGRDRQTGASAERARNAVAKRIRDALLRIRNEQPSLGHHLATTIKTGVFCSYRPDPTHAPQWQVSSADDSIA